MLFAIVPMSARFGGASPSPPVHLRFGGASPSPPCSCVIPFSFPRFALGSLLFLTSSLNHS